MKRFCQRCRVFREVHWNEPGTAQYCAPCLEELRLRIPTDFQFASHLRRKKNRKARVAEVILLLDNHKAQLGCCFCPESDPACLDFHHEDPAEKVFNISVLARKKPDLAFLMKEIEKCKVICANCRRKHHRRQRDGELAATEESADLKSRSLTPLTEGDFPRVRKVRSSPERPPGFDEAMAELRRQCFPEPTTTAYLPANPSLHHAGDAQREKIQAEPAGTPPGVSSPPDGPDSSEIGLDVIDPE